VRLKALAIAFATVAAAFGGTAPSSYGGADEPHQPIEIDGDEELRGNLCGCIRNPGAAGTPSDPFVISDWRIDGYDGNAIEIRDIGEEHFVIRDNTLEASKGVVLENTGDRGRVFDNDINFGMRGVQLKNSATDIANNVIQASRSSGWLPHSIGVQINGGSPTIAGNYIALAEDGISSRTASPEIIGNNIVNTNNGMLFREATSAEVRDNTIRLADHYGIHLDKSAHARVISNEVRDGQGGILAMNADLYMQDNEVFNQDGTAVHFLKSSVQMFRNNISDNWRGAFGSTDSDVTIQDNVFRNNGNPQAKDNAALRLEDTKGRVEGNTIDHNGLGIQLEQTRRLKLVDNTLTDNGYGFSIPYSSRGTIPLMSGNVVNGVNVDGADNPGQQRIFYNKVNKTIDGKTFDSGKDDGYAGTLMEQGALVIYDSKDMAVQDSEFLYNDRGATIRGSQFVTVENNEFRSNQEAVVVIDSRAFIKNNECDIDIDPPETVCFVAEGGFVGVQANVIANVDVGVEFGIHGNVAADGIIANNEIEATTHAALELQGRDDQTEHDVTVEANVLSENRMGAVLANFQGTLESNVIVNSTWVGVRLEQSSDATFVGNEIEFNARGVVEARDCSDADRTYCSDGTFEDNQIRHNTHVGVHLESEATFDGDVIAHNDVGMELEGAHTIRNATVSSNTQAGVEIDGRLNARDSNVSANGQAGARVEGQLIARDVNASDNGGAGLSVQGDANARGVVALHNDGDGMRAMGNAEIQGNFSHNARAGLRLGGTVFHVSECEASFNANGVVMVGGEGEAEVNPDLPGLPSPPDPPDPTAPSPDLEDDEEQDPLWMSECDLVKNEEFALKARATVVVNASENYWGALGPQLDVPVMEGSNVISANANVLPYYKSRAHDTKCFVPAVEPGIGDSVDLCPQEAADEVADAE